MFVVLATHSGQDGPPVARPMGASGHKGKGNAAVSAGEVEIRQKLQLSE